MLTKIAESSVTGSGIEVAIRIWTDADPGAGLAVLALVLDQAMLSAAEAVFVPELKRALSIQGPPPSEPYTPPHKVDLDQEARESQATGLPPLSDSIGAWANPDGGIAVGSTNKYGLYLEIGTQDMAPRPWLVPTLTRPDVTDAFMTALGTEIERLLAIATDDGPPADQLPVGARA